MLVDIAAQREIVDKANKDTFVLVAKSDDTSLDAFRIVPGGHHEQRLVCPPPIEQAGNVSHASRLKALPRIGYRRDRIIDAVHKLDTACLPHRPEPFLL